MPQEKELENFVFINISFLWGDIQNCIQEYSIFTTTFVWLLYPFIDIIFKATIYLSY